MNTLDTLVAAKSLIAKRGGWCKGCWARDRKGNEVNIDSPEAVSFCMDGSLGRIQGHNNGGQGEAYNLLHAVNKSLASFNDTASKKQVLAAFDAAIARLSAPAGGEG